MNKQLNEEELKKFAEEIGSDCLVAIESAKESMQALAGHLAEQLSNAVDTFSQMADTIKVGSAKQVDPSRQRFKEVACKGRNRKRGGRKW